MPSFSSADWWAQLELEDDVTLTRKMGRVRDFATTEELTGIEVHPAFAPEVTPVFLRSSVEASTSPYSAAPASGPYAASYRYAMSPGSQPYQAALQSVTEVDVMPYGAMPSAPQQAFLPQDLPSPTPRMVQPAAVSFPPEAAPVFSPAVPEPRALPDLSRPKIRPRFDSETSTWRKTIPALRRMIGMRGAPASPQAPIGSLPPPAVTDSPERAAPSTLLALAVAVSLVAMVVMTVVGFASRASEAALAARTRVVSASGPNGELLNEGRVFVDGAAQCEVLPCELELADGEHWVTVRSPGFETPPSRSISVGADQPSRIHFELSPTADRVPTHVSAAQPQPAQATVAVAALTLPPSPVPAPAPVVEPAPAPVPAPAAAPARGAPAFRFAPPAAMGRLNINSIPAANVVVDGRPRGRTPIIGLRVKAGAHSVVFIGPEGQRVSRGTLVEAGATATVAARL